MFRTRGFLGCLSLVLSIFLSASPARGADARPNIVFAFADDWGRHASAYGKLETGGPNDVVRTPHFDRVAREGVLFRRAFVNSPSCTPCRSSLLSGQYFWRTGRAAILQGAIWDPDIPSFPLLLKEAGYHVGHTAKVWSPGSPVDAPFGGRALGYNAQGRQFNGFSQAVARAENVEGGKQRLYEQVRGNFRDFLAKREDEDQPYCYWFGSTNCHRKWIQGSGKKQWGIDPDSLKGKLPPFLPDVPVVREDFADYLGEIQAFDAMLGVLLNELEARGELERTMIVVSGDHGFPGMPQGKCNLYDFGVAVPLAVRWPGAVPAGRVVEDFVNLTDLAPTFLEAAGRRPPEVMTGRSLVPVLRSSEGGQVDPKRDHVVVGRERHVAAARPGRLPYPQRAIRTKDFLYIRNFKPDRWPMGSGPGMGEPEGPMPSYEELRENTFAAFADLDASPSKAWIVANRDQPGVGRFFEIAFGRRPAEELYDLRIDPHQMNNVADEDGYEEVRVALEERLLGILRETGDPRVTGDGATFDLPPFAGKPE